MQWMGVHHASLSENERIIRDVLRQIILENLPAAAGSWQRTLGN
jgi:hypothetical protein